MKWRGDGSGPATAVLLSQNFVEYSPFVSGTAVCYAPTTPTLDPILDADKVRVTVCVDLAKLPLANTLRSVGICPDGKGIRASSLVTKEDPP